MILASFTRSIFTKVFCLLNIDASGSVVNSVREWVIRKKDLVTSGQDQDGPICLKLKPDGTWDRRVIPCVG